MHLHQRWEWPQLRGMRRRPAKPGCAGNSHWYLFPQRHTPGEHRLLQPAAHCAGGDSSTPGRWQCEHCTMHNSEGAHHCQMCHKTRGVPRSVEVVELLDDDDLYILEACLPPSCLPLVPSPANAPCTLHERLCMCWPAGHRQQAAWESCLTAPLLQQQPPDQDLGLRAGHVRVSVGQVMHLLFLGLCVTWSRMLGACLAAVSAHSSLLTHHGQQGESASHLKQQPRASVVIVGVPVS